MATHAGRLTRGPAVPGPGTADPELSDPELSDPGASDLEASDLEASDLPGPEGPDLAGTDPGATDAGPDQRRSTDPRPAGSPGLRLTGLVRAFGDRRVLDGLDLTVAPGEFVALIGRSGSGKSTLLRVLAGIDRDVTHVDGLEAPAHVSMVFQDARLLPWRRVLDNVVLGLPGPDARDRARTALAEVGLAGRQDAWPVELSGGEQQRVALARSLVREPELLLADEPFGALDALTRIRMHALLRRLCQRHRPAVLLVTHDVDEAIALADRVVLLEHGRIGADLPVHPAGGGPSPAELRSRLLELLGVEADPTGQTSDAPAPGDAPAPPADPDHGRHQDHPTHSDVTKGHPA